MIKIITFLGISNYEDVCYCYKNKNVHAKYIQECIYRIVEDISDEKPLLIIGLTKKARDKNWGELKYILDKNVVHYKDITINECKNDDEFWDNFNILFNQITESDDVYVDVTHSFRSIPFLVMPMLNYAKFAEDIIIRDIFYGAFDAKDENGVVPIFNLSIFNQVTDWTIASNKFLDTGDSRELADIIRTQIKPILCQSSGQDKHAKIAEKISKNLENFSGALYTVRGNSISEDGVNLKEALEKILGEEIQINTLIPFNKIVHKIYDKVKFYSGDIVLDIHHTIKLCLDFGLIQQGYTFLRENIINYLCSCIEIELFDEKVRQRVEKVISSRYNHESRSITTDDKEIEDRLDKYLTKDLVFLFCTIGSNYRNDINHAGYRNGPKKHTSFKNELCRFIHDFENITTISVSNQ